MSAARIRALALATVMLIGLVGCAPTAPEDTLTVDEAKTLTQAKELEIVGHIPDGLVVAVDQQTTGSLLSCEGDRDFMWAGGIVATLTPDADVTAVIDGLYNVYADQEGWRAQRKESAKGAPQVRLADPDGGQYLAGGLTETSTIEVHSYSPCFHLPEGQSSRGGF